MMLGLFFYTRKCDMSPELARVVMMVIEIVYHLVKGYYG